MILGAVTLLLLALLFFAERSSRKRLAHFGLPGSSHRILGDLATLAALTLLFMLLGSSPAEEKGPGPALALAVDVSASMASSDGETSRLERARREIRALLAALPGARFALVLFAGEAVLQVPLTADPAALAFFVDRLSPGTVTVPGSAPEEGVTAALKALAGETGPQAVILFSDGERTVGTPPPLLPSGVPVYAVPLGTPEGSPVLDAAGHARLDPQGEPLLTRLEAEVLETICGATDGALLPVPGEDFSVAPLIERFSLANRKPTAEGSTAILSLVLLLLLAGEVPGRFRHGPKRGTVTAVVALTLCGLTLACHPRDNPSPRRLYAEALETAAADRPLEAARLFAAAARILEGTERGAALYNAGTLLLGAGDAKKALSPLEEAILLLPGDRQVRTNLALTLRALGEDLPYGSAPGEKGEEREGGTLSRSQALQLLETVIARPGGDAASTVPLFEIRPGRDW
ncbi:von Willebrand factor type A domain-containing protein [Desulfuromonas soudanensis]|uniref:von Willebrand factor type A domain-containing protein n=1 Tax=Desulfuromonas soudanensis TaxID=1603606 RepID=A0A0M5IZA4_9BACT|nr:VWA domain-containing protein [Desulfuromonas soudanensis]ALC17106.1 von Willebrand factor type A domain-containing protein [Desulfuromonas soudanensis]